MTRVYVASKTRHAETWKLWRSHWKAELPSVSVVSSWLDMAGDGEGLDWPAFIDEASTCDLLIAMYFQGDEWKGAFVEIGAALAGGADVVCVGDQPPGSWVNHPRVLVRCSPGYSPGAALVDWLAKRRGQSLDNQP